jgi:hypothetical protein
MSRIIHHAAVTRAALTMHVSANCDISRALSGDTLYRK